MTCVLCLYNASTRPNPCPLLTMASPSISFINTRGGLGAAAPNGLIFGLSNVAGIDR